MLDTFDKIKYWLDEMDIKNYTINKDLTVDVDGDVNLSRKDLSTIPVQFGIVKGDFMISGNYITSLEGSPKILVKSLYAMNCALNTLKGSPKIVYGGYYVRDNNLKDLKYATKNIGENLECNGNQMPSLKNNIKTIGGVVYADYFKEFEEFYDEKEEVIEIKLSQINDYYKQENLYKKLNKKLDNKSSSKKVKL